MPILCNKRNIAWLNFRCEEFCPEGYWGDDCYHACQCKNNNYVCHPTSGCICRPGYGGKFCNLYNTPKLNYLGIFMFRIGNLVKKN